MVSQARVQPPSLNVAPFEMNRIKNRAIEQHMQMPICSMAATSTTIPPIAEQS